MIDHGRRTQERFELRRELPNAREAVESASREILDAVAVRGYDPASTFAIRLALEEALANAFQHGNRNHPDLTVTLEAVVDSEEVTIEIEDRGEGFDPVTIPDPTAEENLEIPAGRGITLIQSFMTTVEFHPPGNRLRMTYTRPAGKGEGG